jgi:hypothetical protein
MAKLINLIPNNQKPKTNEALEDMEVALPSKVEKFLDRLVQTIKSYNLPKKKEQAVIARVMDSMGVTTSELNQAVQKLKKYDVVKRKKTGNDDHDFMGENLNEASLLSTYYDDANADRSTMKMAKELDNLLKTLITDKRKLEEVNKLITYLADAYAQDEINKTI